MKKIFLQILELKENENKNNSITTDEHKVVYKPENIYYWYPNSVTYEGNSVYTVGSFIVA